MKKLFFLVLLVPFISCQPDTISRQVVVPATLETVKTHQEGFNVVTTLQLLKDSVAVWSNCKIVQDEVMSDKTDFIHKVDRTVCSKYEGIYYAYKGVLIAELDGTQTPLEIVFISKSLLGKDDLIDDGIGTYIKVRAVQNFELTNWPSNTSDKIFVYEEN